MLTFKHNLLAFFLAICAHSFINGAEPQNSRNAAAAINIDQAYKESTKQLNPTTPAWFINFVYDSQASTSEGDIDKQADKEVERILRKRPTQPKGITLKQLGSHDDTLYVAVACCFVDTKPDLPPTISAIKSLTKPSRVIRGSEHQHGNAFYFHGVNGHLYKVIHP